MRDIDTIDGELKLVATLRRAARERGGPLPSIDVADALLDERAKVTADHGGGLSARFDQCGGTLDRLVAEMRGFMQGCKMLHPQFGGT
jgi:hypothetical protein